VQCTQGSGDQQAEISGWWINDGWTWHAGSLLVADGC